MILRKITLENFRQFYGKQTIHFAPPGERNVTLVHAENGVGKTTLLNAVLWTFFEDTTRKFEQREKVVNFSAYEDGVSEAGVEVEFDHGDRTYIATRSVRDTKNGNRKVTFTVVQLNVNGTRSGPLDFPDHFAHSVIPRNMAQYFFFDGEQAETFSSETNYKKVGAAIRDILGCLLLENSKGDLDYLARKYDEELGSLEGEELIRTKEQEISFLQEMVEKRNSKISECTANIEEVESHLEELTESLRKARESALLQGERDHVKNALKQCENEIKDAEAESIKWLGSKGIPLVSELLTKQTLDFVNTEALRGRIPSPYNEEFVENLLKAMKCICDRDLVPGTHEHHSVKQLLKHAANAEAMNRVVRVRARIAVLRELREEAPSLLRSHRSKLSELSSHQRKLQANLDDISARLEGLPLAEIKQREAARKAAEKKVQELRLTRNTLETENTADYRNIEKLRREVDALALKNEFARKLVRRRDLATRASTKLVEILKHYENEARLEIQRSVNEILERVARKHYKLEIGENFELRLLYSNGQPTPKSGGENQLMSLAFISSLVQFAKRRSEDKSRPFFVPATVAPLILDSPFGQLDDNYRIGTASFVPEMAPQVVLLVSSSQGKAEVIDSISSRIGAEYVLISENKASRGERKQDVVVIDGRSIITTLFDCPRDLTRVERIAK